MEDYFDKQEKKQQRERRTVQAGHLRACTDRWEQEPTQTNLRLMLHVMERIKQDESMVEPREWNLKQSKEE